MESFAVNNNTFISYLDKYNLQDQIDCTVMIVEKIVFKEDSGYGIYIGENEEGRRFSICGVFSAELVMYVKYHIEGVVTSYKGEKQVTVNRYEVSDPEDEDTMYRIMMHLDKMAYYYDQIVGAFGKDALFMIQENPAKVANEVEDLTLETVVAWQNVLNLESSNNKVIDSLVDFGISVNEARNALGTYGSTLLQIVKNNPYGLIGKIPGLDFPACDKLALKSGMKYDDLRRIKEAFLYTLSCGESNGHCYMGLEEIMEEVVAMTVLKIPLRDARKALKSEKEFYEYGSFSISLTELSDLVRKAQLSKQKDVILFVPTDGLVGEAVQELRLEKSIAIESGRCYKRSLWEAEEFVASKIVAIDGASKKIWETDNEAYLDRYLELQDIKLEDKQREAVLSVTERAGGFFVIQGGPGSGKTFTSKIILSILAAIYKSEKLPFNVVVLAPTGRASKVLRDQTGYPATTIHRGLGCNAEGEFTHNKDNPLVCDVLLLDEASMLDIRMAADLLSAIPTTAKVIFVGDVNQLPSIEAGNVLEDIIKVGRFPVHTLDVPKRQMEGSSIVKNADRIVKRMMIHSDTTLSDTFVVRKDSVEACREAITDGIDGGLDIGYDLSDIQILCPTKQGGLGTIAMNHCIQQIYNPRRDGKPEVHKARVRLVDIDGKTRDVDTYFRKGDKVIQIQNNYKADWYVKKEYLGYTKSYEQPGIMNGECGVIEDIFITKEFGRKDVEIYVRYDGGFIRYYNNFKEIDHAFAITIHKSQGSQWPIIIMPILSGSNQFLTNNLIYTGFSRSREISIVIGNLEVIKKAIQTKTSNNRNTTLAEKLKEAYTNRVRR